ncbi:MAG: hypothetical protein ACI9PY_002928 [Ascidiaceihabitans sp.]|jgi:uncharacterized protein YjbI with pentapeptide repeats
MSSLRSWLGFAPKFDFSKARSLGACVGVVLVLLIGSLFALAVIAAFKVLGTSLFGDLPQGASASFGLTSIIVAMIGAPFVIWRTMVAQKQTDVAEQGMITERIMKAVEGLGAEKLIKDDKDERNVPNVEVRIGAIYSLERIAQDSKRDHIQIVEILCAYVRNNCGSIKTVTSSDVEIAMMVLGRRSQERIAYEKRSGFKLDLEGSNFCMMNLKELDFSQGLFSQTAWFGCKLTGNTFSECDFSHCEIEESNIEENSFEAANFEGSKLNASTFESNSFEAVRLNGSQILLSSFWRDLFQHADLTNAFLFGIKLWSNSFLGGVVFNAEIQKSEIVHANFSGLQFKTLKLDDETDFSGCNFRGAAMHNCDLSKYSGIGHDFEGAYIHTNCRLSTSLTRSIIVGQGDFYSEWASHQASIGYDPEHPQ